MSTPREIDRRTLLRGALASSLLLPAAGALAACASPGSDNSANKSTGKKSADNPFGLADNSSIEAVIFNGGYGYDYVSFAADQVKTRHKGLTIKVSPSTQIAQELQPRFVAGNPPDVIDNSGAGAMAISAVVDQLATLDDVLAAQNYEGTKISDTLYPGVTAPGTYNGKFVALNYVMTVYAMWYSASLFEANGWQPPKTWDDLKALGAKAKAAGKYLFVWGKEAADYYQWLLVDSAIKEAGQEVRVGLENLEPNAWSHPAIQSVLKEFYDIVKAGYFVPGGAGTQFTAAQAKWSNDEQAIMYVSGGWIENEMKKATKPGFKMTGIPMVTLSANSTMPYEALRASAAEAYIVPSQGKNVAGGKEILRAMLSKEAASNFAKTRLAPPVVKGVVPDDGFGSTALVSQAKMLNDAGTNVFALVSDTYYGMGPDHNVLWNSFLSGKLDVAGMTKGMQDVTDKVAKDPSVKKLPKIS